MQHMINTADNGIKRLAKFHIKRIRRNASQLSDKFYFGMLL